MASKRLNGVWRPGAGAEVWYTGLSFADFVAKDAALFARNMRMVDLDTTGGFSAVWRPGSDSQVWYTGLSRDEFHARDTEQVGLGNRLVSLRAYGGKHTAVWRTGSGSQQVLATSRLSDLLDADRRNFAAGMRIQTFRQDFDKRIYYGVWRSDLGTGAQWLRYGMSSAEFTAEDARQNAAGMRLVQITSINGITGLWRSGSGEPAWALEQPYEAFVALRDRYTGAGLRLVGLSVGYV